MPNRPVDSVEELLDRYLSEGRTSTETTELDAYFSAHPARERAARALFDALSRSGQTPPDVVRAWAAMRARIERDLIEGVPDPTANRPLFSGGVSRREKSAALRGMEGWGPQTLRGRVWPTMTALVVAIMLMVVSWTAGVHHDSRRNAAATSTYTTGNGQRANFTLPDGSTVALNVASRLDVPADYLTGHHTVRLLGEALFTVTHHEGTPLTVIAGPVTARVLGTSFVVQHYPSDTVATVAVREGRVAVRSLVLTAARQVAISQTGVAHFGQADPSQFSFATGVLTLNKMPLRDAIAMLDRWFDADIRLGNTALGARHVTGGFTVGTLSDLAGLLELTFNVRVVREGRVLTVYPR